MTPREFLRRFPHASKSTIAANSGAGDSRPIAEPKPAPIPEPQKADRSKAPNPGRVLVRVTSIRKRLIDEDCLVAKFHVDALRYAGILDSDAPDKTKIEVTQRKAEKGEEERVIIEIYEPL